MNNTRDKCLKIKYILYTYALRIYTRNIRKIYGV